LDYRQNAVVGRAARVRGPPPPAGHYQGDRRRRRRGRGIGMKLAELFRPGQDRRLRLARQSGICHAIAGVGGALGDVPRPCCVETLWRIKAEFEAAGFVIAGVESHPVPAEKIKLGLEGRDEEIENYKAAIDALAKVGIPMICYN